MFLYAAVLKIWGWMMDSGLGGSATLQHKENRTDDNEQHSGDFFSRDRFFQQNC